MFRWIILAATLTACGGGSEPCAKAARNIASIRFADAPAAERDKRIDNMVGLCKRKGFSEQLLDCYTGARTAADVDACDEQMVDQGKSGVETEPPGR